MPSTLKQGSTGIEVAAWQKLIGVNPADGNFGPATRTATIDWQTKQKLVADGIVGTVSWATAQKTPIPKVKTSSAMTDAAAYEIAKRAAPELTEAQRQYVLTVARGEGFYGHGWATPSTSTVELSQKFGLTGYEGKGSNNWGADQGSGSAGSFQHVDYGWKTINGVKTWTPYVGTYKKQKTPEEGFNAMKKIILNGGMRGAVGATEIKTAIDNGKLRDAVFAQHRNKYFELDPNKYLTSVLRNYNILTTNVEWKQILGEAGPKIAATDAIVKGLIGVAVCLGGGLLFYKLRT